ncbi:MAG: MBL fold metallo-hydrolase, partial [Spirochaetales bacterium]|nr:MBL fold metallo-hydrolase [Candidatus Physcosoma equi]
MTRITFLGTGTSNGVPQIGCHCPVCSSFDPRDKRYRSSILIEKGKTKVVIDTGYEFRLQCLRAGIDHLDAVLYTHGHPDHLFGLDDLRVFSKNGRFPIYTMENVYRMVEDKFPYAFLSRPNMGIPQLEYRKVEDHAPFQIGELEFIPF